MFVLNTPIGFECHIPTSSGRHVDLLAPTAAQIEIADIARGLAYQACYNGQTSHFYSLAQRALLVASLVPLPQRLAALLHDAPSAYFGDITPALRQLLPEVDAIEKKLMAAISERFSLSRTDAAPIKRARLIALATEQRDIKPACLGKGSLPGQLAPVPRRIEFMPPEEACYQFTELFSELVSKGATNKALHAVPVRPGKPCSLPRTHAAPAQSAMSGEKNSDARRRWLQTMHASSK